jgi:hypothetical protein
MTRRFALPALALSVAMLAAACAEPAAPPARASGASAFANGLKLGQCFYQLGLTGTQIPPGDDGNATITAPAGEVVTRVAVKAGTPCWYTPDGVTGAYTILVQGQACYVVAGLGTPVATVTRVGFGPDCKDISHVELISGAAPPPTALQLCVVLTGANPPAAALTFAYPFDVAGHELLIQAGACSSPVELPAGDVLISEAENGLGVGLIDAATVPIGRIVSVDVAGQTVTAKVVDGSTTIVTITNLFVADPGGDHIVIVPWKARVIR